MPIAEAFERDGEEGFRAREAEVVGALLETADGGAIALGGGSVLSERIRAALGRHVVVWLQVDARESWRRIAHSDRPLATNADDVARLMETRQPLYEELADAVVPMADRSHGDASDADVAGADRAAGGDEDALGDKRRGRVPGAGRARPACRGPRVRLVAGPRAARSAYPTAPSAISTETSSSRLPPASRSSPVRSRRRWPRRSGSCASWPGRI